MNRFSRALEALGRAVDQAGGTAAIVGGLAGIHHNALITTLDIDIVVDRSKVEAFLSEAAQQGIALKKRSEAGWHVLEFDDPDGPVEIHLIPEGEKSPRDPDHAPPTPSPQALGVSAGLGYASLAGWATLKLIAGRDKDRYHLTEALLRASEQQIAEIVVALRPLDPSYLKELHRLLTNAERERQDNW